MEAAAGAAAGVDVLVSADLLSAGFDDEEEEDVVEVEADDERLSVR